MQIEIIWALIFVNIPLWCFMCIHDEDKLQAFHSVILTLQGLGLPGLLIPQCLVLAWEPLLCKSRRFFRNSNHKISVMPDKNLKQIQSSICFFCLFSFQSKLFLSVHREISSHSPVYWSGPCIAWFCQTNWN